MKVPTRITYNYNLRNLNYKFKVLVINTIMKGIINRTISSNRYNKLYWCFTDEAPSLASYSLLPIVKKFIEKSSLELEVIDISLAKRILSQFSENLTKSQKVMDGMKLLSEEIKNEDTNIIKLPNVSASKPQLISAINELQSKGYNIPNFIENPSSLYDKVNLKKFNKVLGSSVNPVLRQGNSDRRLPDSVKRFAKKNPHELGDWDKESKTDVRHMEEGDFYESEISTIIKDDNQLKIILETEKKTLNLKSDISVSKNDIVDVAFLSVDKLGEFYNKTFLEAKDNNLLLSLHLKATMMKVSDPIIFGKAINSYIEKVLEKNDDIFSNLDVNLNNGLASLYQEISTLDKDASNLLTKDLEQNFDSQAEWAYSDSDNNITNLHYPSNMIIDASMPAMIKNSGKMWNKSGKLVDTLAMIPDRMYAGIYKKVIEDCKINGKLDVTTVGSVSNIGLMANKAEEYGSHDKTFQIPESGKVVVYDKCDNVLFSQWVNKGDIWRMCITDYQSIINWINLGINRVKETGIQGVFWLDETREHDKIIAGIVKDHLHDIDNLCIKNYIQATEYTMNKIREKQNVISITGNVLRDYLTDLFPILEAGTSAKMLSIIPLLHGGKVYETGAGGTAPKHMEQFLSESHLRWDSIGEYIAISKCLEDIGNKNNDQYLILLGKCLTISIEKVLFNNYNPGRKLGEIDNKTTSYYICLYWAEEMANYDTSFDNLYNNLNKSHNKILSELAACDKVNDIDGYWMPDQEKLKKILCPSDALNQLLICK